MTPQERIADIQEALRDAKLDGWLFFSFHGSDPFASRILLFDEKGVSTRRWYYLLPSTGEPVKVVHGIEKDKLDALPGAKSVYRSWKELHESLKQALSGRKKICMQYSPLNAIPYVSCVDGGTIELIRTFGVDVSSSADLVQRFESLLDEEQLESHKYGALALREIMDRAFREIGRRIREQIEVTEFGIVQLIEALFREKSLVSSSSPIVAVNENSANPHFEPAESGSKPIRPQDFVLIDIWAKRNTPRAVYADITWTGFAGSEAPSRYANIFDVVRSARDESLKKVVDAVSAAREIHGWEVDDAARGIIAGKGYGEYFIHRTGHSIGEEVHGTGVNIDNLETQDDRLLIPGCCFSLEPGIYFEGDFGIRSEIDVYVGDRDAQVFGQPIQEKIVSILP